MSYFANPYFLRLRNINNLSTTLSQDLAAAAELQLEENASQNQISNHHGNCETFSSDSSKLRTGECVHNIGMSSISQCNHAKTQRLRLAHSHSQFP